MIVWQKRKWADKPCADPSHNKKCGDRACRAVFCRLVLCLLLTGLGSGVLTGCGSAAQVSEGGQGAEETPLAESGEGLVNGGDAAGMAPGMNSGETFVLPMEGMAEEDAEDTISETTDVPGAEKLMSVEDWLIDCQTSTEEREAWIVSFGPLNVRRFCYAKGTIIGSFDAGQRITVTGPLKYGFYPVRGTDLETGAEITGYCSADYVTFMEYTGHEVRLDISRYSQTDGRWGERALGDSQYTMAEIGCTTTCFAMCESYLTGTTITPADMMEMLTYTRGGDLYWPDGYTVRYGSDYLVQIYQKLHQGIPVLIGSRRSGGSQHWVLVTGYDPGDKEITKSSQLKAADFIIKDPGKGRSSLGEFFKDLPHVIKYAYYVGPEGIAAQHASAKPS